MTNGDTCLEALSLRRRGIHPIHRCTALDVLEHCVIRWSHRYFFGLFNYDVMHVLFLNCIGYLLDAVLALLTDTQKIELDRRARSLPSFRNPYSGKTTRKVTRLSSTSYLSAEMKVVHLFVWSHVLGSKALLMPSDIRDDVLVAFVNLQIICYSVRGLRPYTEDEHKYIFKVLGGRFWRALTNIHYYKRNLRIKTAEKYNVGKPPEKKHKIPYYKAPTTLSDESDTVSSSDSDVEPFFIRSAKVIPHAFVHFADQVCMGGTHKFHDTAHPESHHPRSLSFVANRARTYYDKNKSTDNMLDFTMELSLLEGICKHVGIVDEDSKDGRADEDIRLVVSTVSSTEEDSEDGVDFVDIRLSNILRTDDNGLVTLYRGSRGLVAAGGKLHQDTWDTILTEGVPLSVREIVSLVASQLRLPDPGDTSTLHKLLLCSWKLGWHVAAWTTNREKCDFWGGGITEDTTTPLLRGDWIEIKGRSV